jgi:oligoribonuclease
VPHATPDGSGYVLVLDLETSGHDERAYEASLLEFGAILCRDDAELTQVGTAAQVIRPPMPEKTWATMPDVVRQMHTENGLWTEALTGGAMAGVVDQQFAAWLAQVAGDSQVALAGSGVSHFDDRWLRVHMPLTFARLTYWSIDAGVVRRFLQYARRDDLARLEQDVHAKPHRAFADAQLHLEEMRYYLRLIASIPAPEAVPAA